MLCDVFQTPTNCSYSFSACSRSVKGCIMSFPAMSCQVIFPYLSQGNHHSLPHCYKPMLNFCCCARGFSEDSVLFRLQNQWPGKKSLGQGGKRKQNLMPASLRERSWRLPRIAGMMNRVKYR